MLAELRPLSEKNLEDANMQASAKTVLAALTPEQTAKLCALFDAGEGTGSGEGCGGGCGGESGGCGGEASTPDTAKPSAETKPESDTGDKKAQVAESEAGQGEKKVAQASPEKETPAQADEGETSAPEKQDSPKAQGIADMTPDKVVSTLVELLEKRAHKKTTTKA